MGENIADLGGLSIALEAYHHSLGGKPAPFVGGLTGDQRVLLGWAQAWAGKMQPDAIKALTVSDPHSFRKFRVNGVVRNVDAWYSAFRVSPGQALYLKPGNRVRIWQRAQLAPLCGAKPSACDRALAESANAKSLPEPS